MVDLVKKYPSFGFMVRVHYDEENRIPRLTVGILRRVRTKEITLYLAAEEHNPRQQHILAL